VHSVQGLRTMILIAALLLSGMVPATAVPMHAAGVTPHHPASHAAPCPRGMQEDRHRTAGAVAAAMPESPNDSPCARICCVSCFGWTAASVGAGDRPDSEPGSTPTAADLRSLSPESDDPPPRVSA
jgi:hypothetical protein